MSLDGAKSDLRSWLFNLSRRSSSPVGSAINQSSCFSFEEQPLLLLDSASMIPINQAIEMVLRHTSYLGDETVPISQALNRFLAADVIADTDLPPFDRAQMDGYAL